MLLGSAAVGVLEGVLLLTAWTVQQPQVDDAGWAFHWSREDQACKPSAVYSHALYCDKHASPMRLILPWRQWLRSSVKFVEQYAILLV